jgi:UDP-N-acetylglucosamine acyltransferase
MESSTNYIHPTAIIYDNVVMGEHNYIGAYCIIGAPAEHKGNWGTSSDIVVIGDNNVFTGLVTIDGGMDDVTYIGDNNFFMKHSHIGHDVQVMDNVVISCGVKVGGHTIIDSNVNIGLNAVIHQRQFIAKGCMIGMGAVVTKKLVTEPYTKYAGNPAKYLGHNESGNRTT